MSVELAGALIGALGIYLAIGLLFGLAFVFKGVNRLDDAAVGVPIRARLMWWPASAALWPLLAIKWLRGPAAVPDCDAACHDSSASGGEA